MESVIVNNLDKYLDSKKLQVITVFYNPLDFPRKYVARISDILDGEIIKRKEVMVKDTLDEIRNNIPPYKCKIVRCETDALSIIETWV